MIQDQYNSIIMKQKKIIDLLHNTPNHPFNFKAKDWVKINYGSREKYNEDNQIRFKTSMLRSSLCEYSDVYILVKRTITVAEKTAAASDNTNKNVIFKISGPLTNCISRIYNTQVDDVHEIAVVIPMYNLIK